MRKFHRKVPCWNLFFIKLEAIRCFPVNLQKFQEHIFLTDHLRWLIPDRVRSTWKFLLSLGATNRLYSRKMKIYNKKNYENAASLITLDRHLITGSRVFAWHKLSSTETYSLMILNILSKPSFSIYFKNLFNDNDIDWVAIFTLLLLVTYNTYMRSF